LARSVSAPPDAPPAAHSGCRTPWPQSAGYWPPPWSQEWLTSSAGT